MCAQVRRRLPAAKGGGGAGHRNVKTNLSLRKPPLPLVGEIPPLRKAPEGALLRLPLLGQGGHQLAMRPSACPRPRMGTQGEGVVRLSGSHAGQLFSSGSLWDMPPFVVYRVFYLYE